MKKTIFYKICEESEGEYWVASKPYKEWFTLEDTLYSLEQTVSIKTIKQEGVKKFLLKLFISDVTDYFSVEGITRKIVLSGI